MADTGLAEVAPYGYWDSGVPCSSADVGSMLLRKLGSQSAILFGDLAGSGSQSAVCYGNFVRRAPLCYGNLVRRVPLDTETCFAEERATLLRKLGWRKFDIDAQSGALLRKLGS